jgi:DNA-binding transcriptional LysR family regulator
MEFFQLRTFVTVAEEGHLTRAAERLHTSQPAVSAHIKSLEEELGVLLFKRLPKGMQLTAAGKRLREKAVKTLDLENEIRIQAKLLREGITGVVTLGMNINPRYLKISELFATVKTDSPGVELHLLQKASWEVLKEDDLFSAVGCQPQKAAFSDQESTLATLASSGVGLTLMIEDEARNEDIHKTVFARKQPVAQVDLSFAYHRKRANDPVIQAVVDSIRTVWSLS